MNTKKEAIIDSSCESGEVAIRYGDMTQLDDFRDQRVDLVWLGQRIEPISHADGKRMCEATRIVAKTV